MNGTGTSSSMRDRCQQCMIQLRAQKENMKRWFSTPHVDKDHPHGKYVKTRACGTWIACTLVLLTVAMMSLALYSIYSQVQIASSSTTASTENSYDSWVSSFSSSGHGDAADTLDNRALRGPREDDDSWPTVLILSPVKNARRHFKRYFRYLRDMDYPKHKISLGFLESDSEDQDEEGVGTYEELLQRKPFLEKEYRRVTLAQKHYGFLLKKARHDRRVQLIRRSILARSRNYLLNLALQNEEWVLWIDIDLTEWRPNILKELLKVKKPVLVPNCVMGYGERSYDLNSWAHPSDTSQESQGEVANRQLLKRSSHTFTSKYKAGSTNDPLSWKWTNDQYILFNEQLELEGYSKSTKATRLTLSQMRDNDIVPLDGVGGAMLLVYADVHREGLMFPPFPYKGRIETEGLAIMAWDMGYGAYGLPNVEVLHT